MPPARSADQRCRFGPGTVSSWPCHRRPPSREGRAESGRWWRPEASQTRSAAEIDRIAMQKPGPTRPAGDRRHSSRSRSVRARIATSSGRPSLAFGRRVRLTSVGGSPDTASRCYQLTARARYARVNAIQMPDVPVSSPQRCVYRWRSAPAVPVRRLVASAESQPIRAPRPPGDRAVRSRRPPLPPRERCP
jgi:hypothetical protein